MLKKCLTMILIVLSLGNTFATSKLCTDTKQFNWEELFSSEEYSNFLAMRHLIASGGYKRNTNYTQLQKNALNNKKQTFLVGMNGIREFVMSAREYDQIANQSSHVKTSLKLFSKRNILRYTSYLPLPSDENNFIKDMANINIKLMEKIQELSAGNRLDNLENIDVNVLSGNYLF